MGWTAFLIAEAAGQLRPRKSSDKEAQRPASGKRAPGAEINSPYQDTIPRFRLEVFHRILEIPASSARAASKINGSSAGNQVLTMDYFFHSQSLPHDHIFPLSMLKVPAAKFFTKAKWEKEWIRAMFFHSGNYLLMKEVRLSLKSGK
ncbi:hypothetical protein [Bacillus marinisedimentorum]|uniref:hypothetical protein n=1 Tax=Bacillus marinisedimentorum TaxID=1821260 RepID=UPI0007DFE433|nr:hypothetical protein [Bacillus marinisedimentorum]